MLVDDRRRRQHVATCLLQVLARIQQPARRLSYARFPSLCLCAREDGRPSMPPSPAQSGRGWTGCGALPSNHEAGACSPCYEPQRVENLQEMRSLEGTAFWQVPRVPRTFVLSGNSVYVSLGCRRPASTLKQPYKPQKSFRRCPHVLPRAFAEVRPSKLPSAA